MKYFLVWLLLLSKQLFAQSPAGVFINEVMASNTSGITDNTGEYADWIELYNTNPTSIDLAGCYLSDDLANPKKFRFTTVPGQVVIPANSFLIIWASGNVNKGVKHTSFALSADGESIILSDPDGVVITTLSFGPQRTDVSYGRLADGGTDLRYFSPSSPNTNNSVTNAYNEILTPPVFSHSGGFYNAPFSLSISHPDPAALIIYTTDSSMPTFTNLSPISYNYKNSFQENTGDPLGNVLTRTYQSNTYNTPINIIDKTNTPNQISSISSTWHNYAGYIPSSPVYKGTIIRAIAYKSGALSSESTTNSYFFTPAGTNKYSLPVISLSIQEDYLFDYYNGIYTAGIRFDNWRASNPDIPANDFSWGNYYEKGDQFEYPAHFELIEGNTTNYKQNIGVRINGGTTRTYRMKSLRIYARSKYGSNEMAYPMFENLPYTSYNSLLLHNSGQDFISSLLRDGTIHQAVAHLDVETQAYRPSIVFMNGEYWGIHNMRQRYDKYYFNQKYGVDTENLDIITTIYPNTENIDEGDPVHFNAMKNYINTNGLQNDIDYNYINTQMDVDNFIDYQISEIYFTNLDWPTNNIGLWRVKVPYNPSAPKGNDGRWRWYLYDIDSGASTGFVDHNSLEGASSATVNPDATFFLRSFLQNNVFKNNFINRFADLLNTSFLPGRIVNLFETNKNLISGSIAEHINRWDQPYNLSIWNTNVNSIISFVQQRPAYQRSHIRDKFGISGEYNLTVNVSDTIHGYVRVNTIDILPTTPGVNTNAYPWTGSYFDNISITLTARPKTGYKFKHWIYNSTILTDSILTISTVSDRSYMAVFEIDILSSNPTPTAAILHDPCGYSFQQWSSSAAVGSFPLNMKFVYMKEAEPILYSSIEANTSGVYNLSSKTRINGLNDFGVAFINTDSNAPNEGYPNNKLGGAIVALNTIGQAKIVLSWTGRTITANPRKYKIRLQYRIGDIHPFKDLLDGNNQPIEYTSSTNGHSSQFENIILPDTLLNQPYIQFFWRYYYTGIGTSGMRDQLAIDDIIINSELNLTESSLAGDMEYKAGKIISSQDVRLTNPMLYQANKSILLNPGFQAQQNSVFIAKIETCP